MGLNQRFPVTQSDRDNDCVPEELAELARLIGVSSGAGRTDLEIAFQKVVESVHRRRRILLLVQEALSELRLDIKYLMFDLDVTRRERNALREQLEDRREQ